VKRNIHTAFGLAGAFAIGATGVAQQPAAELMPVRVTEPTSVVARGATPYAPFPSIPQAPAESVPAPNFGGSNSAVNGKKSWVSRQWNQTVDFVGGAEARPYAPFLAPEAMAPAKPQANANPNPTRKPATGNPILPVSAPAAPAAPQGVYAGPPAYRWYGWGSTTPGANPHSPTGIYPKASANWYSQTGATPGAFPVPVTYPRRENGAEPPIYVGGPNQGMIESAGRIVIAEMPRTKAPVPYPEYPVANQAPAIPNGTPMPIARTYQPSMPQPVPVAAPPEMTAAAPPPMPTNWNTEPPVAKPAPASAPADPELNWTAVAKSAVAPTSAPTPAMTVPPPAMPTLMPAPAPVPTPAPAKEFIAPPAQVPAAAKEYIVPPAPAPMPPTAPLPAPRIEQDQTWVKPNSGGIVRASANFAVPGPVTYDSIALEEAIRRACPKNVRKVEINRIGGNGLVVRFVVDAEAHAQDAASAIAELTELKALDVRYEALLLAK